MNPKKQLITVMSKEGQWVIRCPFVVEITMQLENGQLFAFHVNLN